MRRVLPYVLALLLGTGAAVLVACGGGSTKGGIPAASAGELKSQLASLQQVVQDHDCDQIGTQLKEVDSAIDGLPATVDERLRTRLHDASDLLRTTALDECAQTTTTPPTHTTTTRTQPTQTQTTETQTQPPVTTTPSAPPTTTTPPVTTQPTQTTQNPAPPPPPAPVVPPAEPAPGSGGGATPGIQP